MISVIIPAYKEEPFLERTIQNIYDTATGEIEIIVVLNGYLQPVPMGPTVIALPENMGERVAMNEAARAAHGDYLFRIDAHCDFSPDGWDELMLEVLKEKPKAVCVGVITAIYHHTAAERENARDNGSRPIDPLRDWTRLSGHWYGLCKLMPNMEAKWYKPNHHLDLPKVVPNMGATGCGMLISKEFYWEIGGADESLGKMGAIGEEFAIKAWLFGEGVYTRTDVTVGHIFGTGGYDTSGVNKALEALKARYGDRCDEIAAHFPDMKPELKLIDTKQYNHKTRTVTVTRTDSQTTTEDSTGKVIKVNKKHYQYIWLATEHHDEVDWTEEQIREKYAPLAKALVKEEEFIPNDKGELVKC